VNYEITFPDGSVVEIAEDGRCDSSGLNQKAAGDLRQSVT
jgi:hypothetical protein